MSLTKTRTGTGTVRLGGTIHDPLDEIPVVEVRQAGYIEGTLSARGPFVVATRGF